MKARLLCRLRPGETRAFELAGGEALIGRDEGLAVSLSLEGVSRRHAKISWDGKSHWLEDLESTNGTFLNGRRVAEREKLRHLSVLTLGSALDLVFLVRSEEPQLLRRTAILHAFLVRDAPDALPHEIPAGEFTVGRSAACNIVSDSPQISKQHARLTRSADKLIVRDLASANGTWLNGSRVEEAALVDGDVVAFAGERYRVSIATGEVTSSSLAKLPAEEVAAQPAATEPGQEPPRFSTEWRQRVEGELEKAAAREQPGDVTTRGTLVPGLKPKE